MEDDEIRAALRRGDADTAFRLLVRAHGATIHARCCRILQDRQTAEDVMQHTMMAAFENRGQLLTVDQIRGWVMQIAVNKSLDVLRSRKRRDRVAHHAAERDAHEVDSVIERLGTTQDRRALEECLATLPPELAAAVLMRYRDGMSWAQIAGAVAMPVDTIRMRVQRGALKSLRDCLASKESAP